MSKIKTAGRVLSGIRPTGRIHLGNYYGAVKNWVALQHEYETFICIVDLHALTTDYATPRQIPQNCWDLAVDLLAAGIDPQKTHLFIQSEVPEHSELHLLLSMMTPLGWLERVPTYKDQQQQLKDRDLSTYGFLGYPMLQAADILLYKATHVPVGEDQVAHVELVREVARRFNHLYGRDESYEDEVTHALSHLDKKMRKQFQQLVQGYQEKGDSEALQKGKTVLEKLSLSQREQELLLGYLEGKGRIILPEPEVLLTETPLFPGLDGRKMSKSYDNTIALREAPESIIQKMKRMPTDPARVRRTDAGDPAKCPVWNFHKIYSDDETKAWVEKGCRSADIGCLDCKQRVIDVMLDELTPIAERARKYEKNPSRVMEILDAGAKAARQVAGETLKEVQEVMGIKRVRYE